MALILRVCGPNGESYNGFRWPLEVGAVVEALDWNNKPECGGGLHGWLHGAGGHFVAAEHISDPSAKWIVAEIEEWIDLDGKVKFPRCVIRFVGDSKSATDYLWEHDPESRRLPVIGAHRADMREGSAVCVGALGHAVGGDMATVSGGYWATVSGGDWATVSGGVGAAVSGGNGATVSGGVGAAVSGGNGASISIIYFDGQKYRRKSGDIGENGLKPNVKYRIENGQFVEAE